MPGSFDLEAAQSYVTERIALTNDLDDRARKIRDLIRKARADDLLHERVAKRLVSDVEKRDAILLKERATLARNRAKLEFGILIRVPHRGIDKAYLAGLEKSRLRLRDAKTDLERFNRLVRRAYTPDKGSPEYDPTDPDFTYPVCWCLVTRVWYGEMIMETSHIVPYAIGEFNASYIFGLPQDDGWRTLWGFENGLLLLQMMALALKDGYILILPDDENTDEFKLFMVEGPYWKAMYPYGGCEEIRMLHNSRLQFKTDCRPEKRLLYLRALVMFFRRYRVQMDGPERDETKLIIRRIWNAASKYVRGSMIRALALEVGDIREPELITGGDLEEVQFPGQLSPSKEKAIAVEVRAAFKA